MFDSNSSNAVEKLSWFSVDELAKFWSEIFCSRWMLFICEFISIFVDVDVVFAFRKFSSIIFNCWCSSIDWRVLRINLSLDISYCDDTGKILSQLDGFSSGRVDIEDSWSILPAAKLTLRCFVDLSRIGISVLGIGVWTFRSLSAWKLKYFLSRIDISVLSIDMGMSCPFSG